MQVTFLAAVVALGCALAWSGFDLSRKKLVEVIEPVPLLALLTLGQAPLFLTWSLAEGWPEFSHAAYWPPALGSLALNVVANLAFIYALKLSPLSLTLPLLSLTPVFTTLLGVPLLDEVPSVRQWTGIVIVVVGAFLLNLQADERVTLGSVLRAFVREPGSRWMMVVVFCWSIVPPLDKLAFQQASVPAHAFILTAGMTVVMVGVLTVQGRLRDLAHLRRSPKMYGLALLSSTAALGSQFIGYGLTAVAFIETVKRGVGNVLALIFGRSLFGESVGAAQVSAVLLMAVGVALILI